MRHQLHIETTFEDGQVATWTFDQPGSAQEAHDSLAARWKAVGATFTRDRNARKLTRHYPDLDHTDVIIHTDIEAAPS